jgi:hypothetical protein
MNDPKTKQDNLNRLYSQILRIDEDGKDFLKNLVTQAAGANREIPMMSDEKGSKAGIKP